MVLVQNVLSGVTHSYASSSLSVFLCFLVGLLCYPSERHMALEKPMETVLLLSLSGVRCITLNQWHSSLQRNACNVDAIMDSGC